MIYKEKYTGDAVIKRGYEIYDEWDRGGFSSRRIVRFTERAVASVQAKNTPASCIEALSCLFALDMRIQEKYNTLFRCLFSYFSWRRETRTFKLLKATLHLPSSGEADIRTAIEVVLQQLREKLENEELDDDDETRGGKRNGKGDEDSAATEEKNQEKAPEANAEELANAEESEELSEEKAEELSEQTPTEEPIKEGSEEAQTAEPLQEEPENVTQEQKEEVKQEESSELKEENNGPEEASEPSTDKPKEADNYNDTIDFAPIFEERESNKSAAEKVALIDEMIMDNMVKGEKDIIGNQRIDEAERNKAADIRQDTVASQNENTKSIDQDAYLYDKMIAIDKGGAQQPLNAEATKQAEKVSEIKTEQPKETIQKNENLHSTKQELNPLRERFQADLNTSIENQVIKELGNTMSDESREAFAQMQMDLAREKLSITYEELGIDEPAEIIGMREPEPVTQPSVGPNRK